MGDVLHGKRHVVSAVAGLVEEGLRRLCIHAERVYSFAGVQVAEQSALADVDIATVRIGFNLAVGRNPRHTLMAWVVVGLVIGPDGSIVVAVHDEHSAARQSGIPTNLLSVLQHEVLIGMGFVVDDVGFTAILQCFQVADAGRLLQFNKLAPSGYPAFVACIACWHKAVAVVGAHVHQVPAVHARSTGVVGVVEVGITQAVAKLMAHRADTVDGSHAIQLSTAGISVDAYTVECLCTRAVAIIGSRREFPLMGPDGALCTTVGFALSAVDHVDLIHLTIAIPVVVGIVNIIIGQLQGLNDHLGRIHVVALRVVLSVVGVGLRHGVGAHNVEVQFEDTFALGIEIVVHGPLERAMVEILLVGDAFVEVSVILFLELGCAKVHQYDEASLFAHVTANLTNLLAAKTFGTACVRLLTAGFSTQFQLL